MKSLAALLALGLVTLASANLRADYNHFVALDTLGKMRLYWSVDKNTKTVSFAIEANTTGWVGFGLSPGAGQMKGSDIVIGWVKNGEAFLTDRYADGEYLPAIDEHNDYDLISGAEENGVTTLKFKRKIDTCDKRDRKIKEGTTKVIFAFHDEDPEGVNQMKRHSYKGAKSILLLNSQGSASPPDPSWNYFDIKSNNFKVPNIDTKYHCMVTQIPQFTKKNQVVRFEPIIQPGNEGIVHHFVVMACDPDFPEHLANASSDCLHMENMPKELLKCRGMGVMVAAWGVGGGPFVYPEHVGWPIDSRYIGKHFILEIHYNNPDLIKGKIDNSGVRFYYTDKLRKYDAGVYQVGAAVSPWMLIPPKQSAWLNSNYCNRNCNEKALKKSVLPEGGIKFFSAFLHTHLAGRATWTKHIRNGVELPEIARDDNYDFNYQDIQFLNKEVHFLPGDELIHECVYNTMDRKGLSFGGESTKDEMCINFLFYYPFVPEMRRTCTVVDVQAALNIIDKYYPELSNHTLERLGNPLKNSSKTWTEEMTRDYVANLKASTGESTPWPCGDGNPNSTSIREWVKPKYLVSKVKITKPLQKPKDNCEVSSALNVRASLLYAVAWVLAVFAVAWM